MTTKAKAKTSYKTGRPTKYTEALAAEICRRIADGASLRSVCEAEDMPDRETVRRWLREKGGFCGQYDDGRPGEVFIHGAKPGSDVDLLCDDIGVLVSRLLQYGDDPASLAAGIGRLGNGDPASIVGLIADVLAAKAAGPSSPGGEAP